ncbi:putative reverse transcriptase domain-containing protein [Tanacetum coccineum]
MAMTIQYVVRGMILAAQSDAFKQENVPLVGNEMDEAHVSSYTRRLQEEKLARINIYEIVERNGVPCTAYHPQMDGQSEHAIRTLEGMLKACVIDYGGRWGVHLPLAELSYNNSYHSSIQYALFEALYGRKLLIKEKFKAVRDRQRSYAGNRRKPLEFEKGKLTLRYVEPFEILERIGSIAYRLRLPEELSSVHDTFHVSNLEEKKCLADANLHVPLDEIEADKTLRFVEEPKGIMDRTGETHVVWMLLLRIVVMLLFVPLWEEVILLAIELIKFRDEIPLSRGDCDTRDLDRLALPLDMAMCSFYGIKWCAM